MKQVNIKEMDSNELREYRHKLIQELKAVNERLEDVRFNHNHEDGSASDRQIEYVITLLEDTHFVLGKERERLSSFDCHCIIQAIQHDNLSEGIRDHFESLCWIDVESELLENLFVDEVNGGIENAK